MRDERAMRGQAMRSAICFLILGSMPLTAAAADQFSIGGVAIALQMEREKVWQLVKVKHVECVGENDKKPPACNSWLISETRESSFAPLGNVAFTGEGHVKSIYKYYSNDQWGSQPEKFVTFLYEVLRQYAKEGEAVTASIGEVRQPGWENKVISFHFGKKTVRVSYGAGGRFDGKPGAPFVTIHEELR
jgi:hypothetical protein